MYINVQAKFWPLASLEMAVWAFIRGISVNTVITEISCNGSIYSQHCYQHPGGGGGGTLNFSSYIDSGPPSTLHPKRISGIPSTQKKIFEI